MSKPAPSVQNMDTKRYCVALMLAAVLYAMGSYTKVIVWLGWFDYLLAVALFVVGILGLIFEDEIREWIELNL